LGSFSSGAGNVATGSNALVISNPNALAIHASDSLVTGGSVGGNKWVQAGVVGLGVGAIGGGTIVATSVDQSEESDKIMQPVGSVENESDATESPSDFVENESDADIPAGDFDPSTDFVETQTDATGLSSDFVDTQSDFVDTESDFVDTQSGFVENQFGTTDSSSNA
jgi:hypothetical protein